MSDIRWLDVRAELDSALKNFGIASEIRKRAPHSTTEFERDRDDLAIMHALQIGHRSVEQALIRVLRMLEEEEPTGEFWHADLLRRAGSPVEVGDYARPAILPQPVVEDLQETRRFRHVAMHGYAAFDMARAGPTLLAAERLKSSLLPAFESFQNVIDAYDDMDGAELDTPDPRPPSPFRPR